MVWIIFTSQSTLILDPKIMLILELVCDTLNIIFGVACRIPKMGSLGREFLDVH
jgi:hypothetical protein